MRDTIAPLNLAAMKAAGAATRGVRPGELPCQRPTICVLAAIKELPTCYATHSSSYVRGTLSSASMIPEAMIDWPSAYSNPPGSGSNAQSMLDAFEWTSRFKLSNAVG